MNPRDVPLPPLRRLETPKAIVFNESRLPGLQFTERMVGWWSVNPDANSVAPTRSQYEAAATEGETAGRRLELLLTVSTDDLEAFLSGEDHEAEHESSFVGTAEAFWPRPTSGPDAEVAPPSRPLSLLVGRGGFKLFTRDLQGPGIQKKKMEYEAYLTAPDGARWWLQGFKSIKGGGFHHPGAQAGHGVATAWRDLTTLFFTLWPVSPGWASSVSVASPLPAPGRSALGVLKVTQRDFLRQFLTVRGTGGDGPLERFDTRVRFLAFFAGVLRDTYGGTLARGRYASPDWARRRPRSADTGTAGVSQAAPLRVCVEQPRSADGSHIRLTRYRGRVDRNLFPVILAPGWGVRAASFAIDTVETNLVAYLCDLGYEVWLLDHRASPELGAIRAPFSLEHVADYDWPCAVNTVCEKAGVGKVNVLAHCLNGASFMMSALSEKLRGKIHRAIVSQLATHPVTSVLNDVRIMAGLGPLLQFRGVEHLEVTVDVRGRLNPSVLNWLLKHYPTSDPCDNPVCRRVRFVFGESYLHANLNRETHERIVEMFGNPWSDKPATMSLRSLRHVARMVTAGRIVKENGDDAYLTQEGAALLDFPIALLGGSRNEVFLPAGIEATHAWLTAYAPHVRARRIEIEGYGHMDCFIGAHAHRDVYPRIREWLAGS